MLEEQKFYRITTFDNPFDPWLQEDEWFQYDEVYLQHHTSRILADISGSAPTLSAADSNLLINDAIDRLVALMPKIYKKVPMPAEMIEDT